MLTKLALLVALLALVLGAVLLADLAPVKADDDVADDAIEGVTWLTDLDQARDKARETGRPILAVFR